jgi:regulator of cell morphogenesis and NO signaling
MTVSEFETRTVGELAAELPNSIRVFEAWQIDYCCGGRTALPDACAAAGHGTEEFVVELMRASATPNAPREWKSETLESSAAAITAVYHVYTREELATIAPIADKVLGVHGSRHAELREVVTLVSELTTDLLPHMLKEEQVLFPYALTGGLAPTPFFGTVKNPVRMMMLEHDRVGELLAPCAP